MQEQIVIYMLAVIAFTPLLTLFMSGRYFAYYIRWLVFLVILFIFLLYNPTTQQECGLAFIIFLQSFAASSCINIVLITLRYLWTYYQKRADKESSFKPISARIQTFQTYAFIFLANFIMFFCIYDGVYR